MTEKRAHVECKSKSDTSNNQGQQKPTQNHSENI
jgi:hypothetical protein